MAGRPALRDSSRMASSTMGAGDGPPGGGGEEGGGDGGVADFAAAEIGAGDGVVVGRAQREDGPGRGEEIVAQGSETFLPDALLLGRRREREVDDKAQAAQEGGVQARLRLVARMARPR